MKNPKIKQREGYSLIYSQDSQLLCEEILRDYEKECP